MNQPDRPSRPGRKRPILTAIIIVAAIGLLLGTAMVLLARYLLPHGDLLFREHLGVVEIEGIIGDPKALTEQLNEFKRDSKIKGVVLRIDSPGGAVGPSQEIYAEVRKLAQLKPVVASLGSVAASGGYYVAAPASQIVANPGTVTGSIGVLMEFVQLKELLEKIGVSLEVLKSGEFKDLGWPHRKLSNRDRELIGSLMADVQRQFVEAVASGRNLPVEAVERLADGRVFSGAQAREVGLVDRLGNFQDAVELTKELAGLRGEVRLVYPKKAGFRLRDLILDSAARWLAELRLAETPRVEYRWR